MCVLLSAPRGVESWRIRRFVELIGHRPEQRQLEVLFGMYATNNSPDGELNEFRMLHPGNVSCERINAWPLPRHSDEPQIGKSIFDQIYGPAFEEREGVLYYRNALTGWDSWEAVESEVVNTFGTTSDGARVRQDFATAGLEQHVPFTSWTVGPFVKRGSYLLLFRMRLLGESYTRVMLPYGADDFRINGPEQVYRQVKFGDLTTLIGDDRRMWEHRLTPFDQDRLPAREGYDVLLLKAPQTMEVRNLLGATFAPIQPQDADRFVSAHQAFCLELRLT